MAIVSSGAVVVTVDPGGLAAGIYDDGRITISCGLADCPIEVPVHLEIVPPGGPQIAKLAAHREPPRP
jgi:hypothetical protein